MPGAAFLVEASLTYSSWRFPFLGTAAAHYAAFAQCHLPARLHAVQHTLLRVFRLGVVMRGEHRCWSMRDVFGRDMKLRVGAA
jgi:hypothetical protein